jgi:hypothetical protein
MKIRIFITTLIFLITISFPLYKAGNFKINLDNSTRINTNNRGNKLSGSKIEKRIFASADGADGINLYEIK